MATAFFFSPLGTIQIEGSDKGVTSVSFVENSTDSHSDSLEIQEAITQLNEYFSGNRKEFSLPLAPEGTPFQKQVWQELQQIPFGEKRSYLDIAIKLGDKNLTRAVGAANGKNPIAIIVPCHRVIAENGALTGYAGGLWRKEWLLDFESNTKQENLFHLVL